MVGRRVSHYTVLESLGAGGMGVVYRARDERLSRDVALKVLRESAAAGAAARQQFQKEALALGRLNHPNIETVYEFGCDGGVDFVAAEYIAGATLDNCLRHGPLSEAETRDIARQIAGALIEAHENGVLHCDLKPANIILTPKGRVKVIDFGLARLKPRTELESTETRSQTGAISGTLLYLAPERFRGAAPSVQSDIYAFGAVLYEMATGKRVLEDGSAAQIIAAVLSQPAPRARDSNPALSEQLERIILRCLEKDPRDRYASAWELLLDLTPSTLSAPAPQVSPPAGRLRRAKRYLVAAMCLAAVTVAATIWMAGGRGALAFSPRDWVLIADVDNQTGESLFDRSLSDAFAISLEQSKRANVFPRGRVETALRRMGKTPPTKVDEPVGRELCIRENIRGLITVAISRVGQSYTLAARLVDPVSGDTVRSYLERALNQDRVLDKLGSIAAQIRRDLGESLSSIHANERPLPQVTTASLRALKSFSDGRFLWTKGEYDAAVRSYQDAIGLDPDFAMAHAALGGAYCSHILNDRLKCREQFREALSRTRLTDRERLFIEAEAQADLGTVEEGITQLRRYLNVYPDDVGTRYNLGSHLMRNQRPDDAVREFKEVLRIAPAYAAALINLATTYSTMGQYKEALVYYRKAFELEPALVTNTNLNNEYGLAVFKTGDEAKAREIFGLALAKPFLRSKGLRSIAMLDLYEGKWRSAETGLREAVALSAAAHIALSEARDRGHLAVIRREQGDTQGAVAELDRAVAALAKDPSPQVWQTVRIAIAYVRAGAVSKGAAVFHKVAPYAEPNNGEQQADVHRMEAELALARGDTARAFELLETSSAETAQPPLYFASLAYAYDRAGRIEDAIAAYEKLAGMKDKCLGWEPQQAAVDAQYRLAELHLSRGEAAECARWLNILEAQLKEADPDFELLRKTAALRKQLALRGP